MNWMIPVDQELELRIHLDRFVWPPPMRSVSVSIHKSMVSHTVIRSLLLSTARIVRTWFPFSASASVKRTLVGALMRRICTIHRSPSDPFNWFVMTSAAIDIYRRQTSRSYLGSSSSWSNVASVASIKLLTYKLRAHRTGRTNAEEDLWHDINYFQLFFFFVLIIALGRRWAADIIMHANDVLFRLSWLASAWAL